MLPERTIVYKTFLKRAIVSAIKDAMAGHPDDLLAKTKVTVEYPTTQNAYPAIIVRFSEREIYNAGVGHVEYLYHDDTQTVVDTYKHYLYNGDIELALFALSSVDRDFLTDSIIQIISMADLQAYTNVFLDDIYNPGTELSGWNYVNINTDRIQGTGETQVPQPWLSEDQLVYQTSYRIGISGEFYSLPPVDDTTSYGLIERVNFYPYDGFIGEPVPEGTDDPAPWGGSRP